METAQIVPLRVAPPVEPETVRVDGETIFVEQLKLSDRSLAAFVAQRPPEGRVELIERALRVGLHALQDAGTSLDVDFVRREFDALIERIDAGLDLGDHAAADDSLGSQLGRFAGAERGQMFSLVVQHSLDVGHQHQL